MTNERTDERSEPASVDLDALDRLAGAATPGPWVVGPGYRLGHAEVHDVWVDPARLGVGVWPSPAERCVAEDAAFIAAASPLVVRALVTYVRELQGALQEATNHLVASVEVSRDARVMDTFDANEERRWIRRQRALVARGAVVP